MNIAVKTQGKRGGNPQWKQSVGYVVAFIGDNMEKYIAVDMYDGRGETYKERETPEIVIMGDNGETLFLGDFEQLKQKLKQ